MCVDFSQIFKDGKIEKKIIAVSKRLFELMNGDIHFFELIINTGIIPAEYINKGIIENIPKNELSHLISYFKQLILKEEQNYSNIKNTIYLKQYVAWENKLKSIVEGRIKRGETNKINHKYNAWRNIQVNRCRYELNDSYVKQLIHIPFALELSSGCSIGCEFCGLEADKLKSVFKYNNSNKKLWKEIFIVLKEHFGDSSTNCICYYATEPSDNPDYLSFLKDAKNILGTLPQTTTALPINRIKWLKDLLKIYSENDIYCRISVNSPEQLANIHQNYSAEELLSIILLINYSDQTNLTKSGKLLRKSENNKNFNVIEGTINCISGFLINLCTKNIKLITPCIASPKYPLGYKILCECNFSNIIEFRSFITEATAKNMVTNITAEDSIKFRDDISINDIHNGIEINSEYYNQTIKGNPIIPKIAKLINTKNLTLKDILLSLNGDGNYLDIVHIVQTFKEQGILRDE